MLLLIVFVFIKFLISNVKMVPPIITRGEFLYFFIIIRGGWSRMV